MGNQIVYSSDGDCVPVIYIDSCDTSGNIVINQSDTTFRLTGNVESGGTCFTIGYDGVTLDFAGFNITGDDTGEDYGVYNDGYDNVTIKNGEIYDFGGEYPSAGIYLANNQNNNITNMTVNSNYQGIYLYSSSDNNLTNITANLNTDTGVYLYSSSNNNFTDITTNSNYYGIYLDSSSDNNILTNITANSNNYGIYLYSSSNNNLTNVYSCRNSNFDFFCRFSDAVGTGNTFKKSKIEFCEDGWPVLNTDYSECS